MARTCLGIDIGTSQLKLAVCTGGIPKKIASADMPDNLVREGRIVSHEAMSGFLKKTIKKSRLRARKCAIILPAPAVFTRTMTVPAMSREHLQLNLPYEFRDFITQEKDKYFYDYAVTGTILNDEGVLSELELIAAAALKETIAAYSAMCRRAGLKLITAIPEELSYMNIIRRFEKDVGTSEREYCFIDLGHTATRLNIYKGIKLQATRVIELGVQLLDTVIAELLGIDTHIARLHKHTNSAGELDSGECRGIYSVISIEVMRAINFYRFNSPESTLNEVFICGGGANIAPLLRQLETDLAMPVRKIDELLPKCKNANVTLCPAAIGVTMQ